MSSSKPSSSNKRKSEWPDVQESFATTKKQRVTKPSSSASVSMHEFMAPSFEPRPQSTKAKEKLSTSSLHASASDLLFKKESKITPMKSPLPISRLDTPKPPKPISIEFKPPTPAKNLLSVLEMAPPRLGQAATPSTPVKPMKSALRTPLIAGAFTSPPKSQKLTVPLTEMLDDDHLSLNPMQAELERGLAPSPEKGAYSSKKQFIRGGLADRAKSLMSRSTTDFSLWFEDATSSKKNSEPQLSVRISEILVSNPLREPPLIPNAFTHNASPRHSVLARCRRADGRNEEGGGTLVLFSGFSGTQTEVRKGVANPSAVRAGLEAQIWKPWTELYIPLDETDPDNSKRKVILCSRFIIK